MYDDFFFFLIPLHLQVCHASQASELPKNPLTLYLFCPLELKLAAFKLP